MKTLNSDRLAYSVADVIDLTGLSRATIYRQMAAGHLTYLKVGSRTLIKREAIEAFLNGETAR
jgi:excisionase family DNA binding protein